MPRDIDYTFYNTARWGCELEGTFATRARVAQCIADYFNTEANHIGTSYDKYEINTEYGTFTVLRDASVVAKKKVNGEIRYADDNYKVEITTPPMVGAPAIDVWQEVVRKLRKETGFAPSECCGMHIHVEIADQRPQTIINIINEVYSHQDMLMKSSGPAEFSPRGRYCQKLSHRLVKRLADAKKNRQEQLTMANIEEIWYTTMGNLSEIGHRYPSARYHIVNLCKLFKGRRYALGTVEFRFWNATNHAGRIRTAIQFSLLLCQYASKASKSLYRTTVINDVDSTKYRFRCYLLKLGAVGDEFKTLRKFMLEQFGNQSTAWRRSDTHEARNREVI